MPGGRSHDESGRSLPRIARRGPARLGRSGKLRRRVGWFELNPGCFGRAALVAAAAAGLGGVAAAAAWRLRAPFLALRVARRLWRWVRG